jgi:hypothetical protein
MDEAEASRRAKWWGGWFVAGLVVVSVVSVLTAVHYSRQVDKARREAKAAVGDAKAAAPGTGVPEGYLDALGVHVPLSRQQFVAAQRLTTDRSVADVEYWWQKGDPVGSIRLSLTYYCWSDLAGLSTWRILASGRERLVTATGPIDDSTGDTMCAR